MLLDISRNSTVLLASSCTCVVNIRCQYKHSATQISVCAVDGPVKPLAGGKRSKKQKKKQRQQQAQMAAANVDKDSDSEHDAAQQSFKPARAASDSGAEEEASEEGEESEDAMLERMMQAANMGTPAQPSHSEPVRHMRT